MKIDKLLSFDVIEKVESVGWGDSKKGVTQSKGLSRKMIFAAAFRMDMSGARFHLSRPERKMLQ